MFITSYFLSTLCSFIEVGSVKRKLLENLIANSNTLFYLIKNTTVDQVVNSGFGLVFITYPQTLSLLPIPQLWCALFFILLFLLGFDTLVSIQKLQILCFYRECFSNDSTQTSTQNKQ